MIDEYMNYYYYISWTPNIYCCWWYYYKRENQSDNFSHTGVNAKASCQWYCDIFVYKRCRMSVPVMSYAELRVHIDVLMNLKTFGINILWFNLLVEHIKMSSILSWWQNRKKTGSFQRGFKKFGSSIKTCNNFIFIKWTYRKHINLNHLSTLLYQKS